MDRTERIITDDSTGGMKGAKLAKPHLMPTDSLIALMEHFGKGEEKYPSDETGPNYAKGYPWSLSFDAMMRHALLWWGGEDYDPETGSHHLTCVQWHAGNLFHFQNRGKGTDDRWEHTQCGFKHPHPDHPCGIPDPPLPAPSQIATWGYVGPERRRRSQGPAMRERIDRSKSYLVKRHDDEPGLGRLMIPPAKYAWEVDPNVELSPSSQGGCS